MATTTLSFRIISRFCSGILLSFILLCCSPKYTIEDPGYTKYQGEINQHTRLIRASATKIFQALTQEEAFQKICPKGVMVAFQSVKAYGVGTEIKTRIKDQFQLIWKSRVEEVVSNKKIRLQFLDGFFAGGTEIWELESSGEYTRLSHTIIVQPKGLLRKLAWIFKVRSKHNTLIEALLGNLEARFRNTLPKR